MVLLAWLRARRRAQEAARSRTAYLVEQLRQDAAARAAAAAAPRAGRRARRPGGVGRRPPDEELRREIAALVERQPDEVAALLRGWLVERPLTTVEPRGASASARPPSS